MLGPRVSFFGESSHCMKGKKNKKMHHATGPKGFFQEKKGPRVAIF
jgi:hypothetical protein